MSKRTIFLSDELWQWIDEEAQSEGFEDANSYLWEMLRFIKERNQRETPEEKQRRKEADLVMLLNAGLESESRPLTRELWAEIFGEADEES